MNIQDIKVNRLVISDQNVRKNANEVNGDADTSIDDLAQSIATQGLINPISVRPIANGMFDVVAGQRRLLAVRSLGWLQISCTVASADMTDNEAKVHSLVENFQRQDNSYSDKVTAFSTLLTEHCGQDMNKLCKMVGVKRKTAERYVAMKKLSADVLEKLDVNSDGKRLSLTSALELTKLPAHQMTVMAETLVGRSIAESHVILDSIRQNPHATAVEATKLAVAAVENHALRVAEDANLVEERTWRADTPWIHHPMDRSRYVWFDCRLPCVFVNYCCHCQYEEYDPQALSLAEHFITTTIFFHRFYEIINIEAAWATLMANGCLRKAGAGVHKNDVPAVNNNIDVHNTAAAVAAPV